MELEAAIQERRIELDRDIHQTKADRPTPHGTRMARAFRHAGSMWLQPRRKWSLFERRMAVGISQHQGDSSFTPMPMFAFRLTTRGRDGMREDFLMTRQDFHLSRNQRW